MKIAADDLRSHLVPQRDLLRDLRCSGEYVPRFGMARKRACLWETGRRPQGIQLCAEATPVTGSQLLERAIVVAEDLPCALYGGACG